MILALVVIAAVAALSTYLTAPRPGGRMDPESTSSEGARALVSLLRDHGVDVIVAEDTAGVERAARPDTLIVVAETFYLIDDDRLRRLEPFPAIACWSHRWRGPGRSSPPRSNWARKHPSAVSRTVTCAKPPGPVRCNWG